jgi:hypothetical protein
VLLALGQFFMKKLALSLPSRPELLQLAYAVLTSPYVYICAATNLVASVTFVASLRLLTLTNTFAIVFMTMGGTVLALDVVVNRTQLTLPNLAGVMLGILAILLIAMR